MRRFLSRLALAAVALTFLMGSDCPLSIGTGAEQPTGNNGGNSGDALDVGGSGGAVWKVSTASTLLVTLRTANGQGASAQVEVGRGSVMLLGRTIAIADFCWRPEIACPQHVLAEATAIRQDDAAVQITYSPRGPLGTLQGNALGGNLSGKELMVPLSVGNAKSGTCGLHATSAIGATAFADGATGGQATAMSGRVAVTYGGTCVALGGSAAMGADDLLQISASFTATRQ